MKNWSRKFLSVSSIAGLALTAASCGSSEGVNGLPPQFSTAPNVSCPSGQKSVGGGACVYAATFEQACFISGGQPAGANRDLCKITYGGTLMSSISWGFTSYIPFLTPGSDVNYARKATFMSAAGPVKPLINDTIKFTGSGSWAKCGLDWSWDLQSCRYKYNINGKLVEDQGEKVVDGDVLTNGGEPAGLMASVGGKSVFLGSSKSFTVEREGDLYLGYNVPVDMTPNGSSLSVSSLSLTRCVDSTNRIYKCE